jgi:hypothetical protein
MHRRRSTRHLLCQRSLALFTSALVLLGYAAPVAGRESRSGPDDPLWAEQWNLAARPGIGIDVREAWRYGRGDGVTVAVVDSGIVPHPEFTGRVLPGYDFVTDAAVANDGDGRDADPTDPGDWVTDEELSSGQFGEDCAAQPSDWHGTHVAGIILASAGNGIGIAGIAPRAQLLPVRVVGRCGGSQEDLVDGLRWAAGLEVAGAPANEHPAEVINISLGGRFSCSTNLQRAVEEVMALDIMIVVAVGNSSEAASAYSPANCIGTATVAALTASGAFASYSNYGDYVDLSAPGGSRSNGILSTSNKGTSEPSGPGYSSIAGTSAAAPHLSGVLAIARGYDPLTPADALFTVLFDSLVPFDVAVGNSGICLAGYCGVGALDAGRFLRALDARAKPAFTNSLAERLTVGESVVGDLEVDGVRPTTSVSTTPDVCSWDGQELRGIARGACMIHVEVPGTASTRSFERDVRIDIVGLTPKVQASLRSEMRVGRSATVQVSTDSGGTITFESRTPRICRVSATGRVTARAEGTCRVRATVAAVGLYDQRRTTLVTQIRP